MRSLPDRRVGQFLPQLPLTTIARSMATGKSLAQRMPTRSWQCHWRGPIEAGGTVGYWQAWDFPTEQLSANRSAVFIMSRVGMVVTDKVKAGMPSGNVELLVEPVFAHFTHPFSA